MPRVQLLTYDGQNWERSHIATGIKSESLASASHQVVDTNAEEGEQGGGEGGDEGETRGWVVTPWMVAVAAVAAGVAVAAAVLAVNARRRATGEQR